jgi:hypothetical protein
MPQTYADVVGVQVEVVSPLLSGFFDEEDSLFSKMEKIPTTEQSGRAMRIPIELRPGGKMRAANFDGGALGTGSGPVYDYASLTPVDSTFAISWNLKTKFTTDSKSKAVVDTVQRTIASAVKEAKIHVDKHLQTSGTGILATVTAKGSAPTYSVVGNGFGARRLRFGDPVSVYDSTQGAYRGEVYVSGIDYKNETVTLSSTLAGAIDVGDKLCVAGLTATPPTYIYGIPYHHNNSTVGTWLGWTRANYPEIITPYVDGGSGPLTLEMIHKLMALMEGELADVFDSGEWIWYMHPKQHFQLIQLMTQISEIHLPMGGGGNGEVDLAFNRKRQRILASVPVHTSINADQTRLDLIDLKNWFRGTYKDLGFLKLGGSTVLPVPNSTSYDAAEISYLAWSQQFACKNPRRGGYIPSLVLPY